MQMQRLKRELERIAKSPPTGIVLNSNGDSLNVFEASIVGPEDTPYSNGIFNLEILIADGYPFCPPLMRFTTKVYHPNIDDKGRICMDLLKMPPKGSWKPTISLESLLISVRLLLSNPNPDDPLMSDIAEEFKNDYAKFAKSAAAFTEQHARGSIS